MSMIKSFWSAFPTGTGLDTYFYNRGVQLNGHLLWVGRKWHLSEGNPLSFQYLNDLTQ